ncbi:DUF2213 domain-containing protein [Bordetella genomosp. 11]|uniref:DUF2213 domain-containing protein n=1 Tax=Bordetella genomosp. 11 TaxID=1416808 RepID=A0A261UEK3_9BORD|nr:DUF2213 domain-containing protein [Bordetella genomosp. 11]OZI59937.1 hypothetical protein CAL28_10650 [Bordetella genomosp. 11]
MSKYSDLLAMDRASVRSVDAYGRMYVEVSNISKATVNPYRGSEIPDWDELNLDPDRIYFLLRDPDELAKAAPTFNGIQLLHIHIPVDANQPRKERVVGCTGTDAVFQAPYLKNSLVVWDAVAIAGIESDEQKELSSAYGYRADMTPGTYEGIAYDGVMRDIRGNHVALVEVGRAGPDVVVGDSNLSENPNMKYSKTAIAVAGALKAYLRPKLAQDAAIGDLGPLVKGLTAKNVTSEKARLLRAVETRFKGKLAQDADLADLAEVIDTFKEGEAIAGDDDMPADPDPADPDLANDDELMGKLRELISAKLSPELAGQVMKALGEPEGAADSPPEFEGKPKDPEMVSKPAMDSAIQKATAEAEQKVIQRMQAVRIAEQEVRPLVGDVVAMDSAEDVYKFALDAAGVDLKDVPPAAYRSLVKMQLQHAAVQKTPRVAMDAKAEKGFADAYPHAANVQVL